MKNSEFAELCDQNKRYFQSGAWLPQEKPEHPVVPLGPKTLAVLEWLDRVSTQLGRILL